MSVLLCLEAFCGKKAMTVNCRTSEMYCGQCFIARAKETRENRFLLQ